MEAVLNSIDEICDLEFVYYSQTPKGHDYYYLSEQSSLQILRKLPVDTLILVTGIFSQRQRIAAKAETIKRSKTIRELFNIVLPLVEKRNFPCDNFHLIVNNEIKLESHDDGEVHLSSGNTAFLRDLLQRVFASQQYDPKLLSEVISQPNLYHRLERPNKIVESYKTFDELMDLL